MNELEIEIVMFLGHFTNVCSSNKRNDYEIIKSLIFIIVAVIFQKYLMPLTTYSSFILMYLGKSYPPLHPPPQQQIFYSDFCFLILISTLSMLRMCFSPIRNLSNHLFSFIHQFFVVFIFVCMLFILIS